MNKDVLKIIICLKCKSSLRKEKDFLICDKCKVAYPFIDKTIPDLLIEDSIKLEELHRNST